MLKHITEEQINELKTIADAEYKFAQRSYKKICNEIAAQEPSCGLITELAGYNTAASLWGMVVTMIELNETPSSTIGEIVSSLSSEYGQWKRDHRATGTTSLMRNALNAVEADSKIHNIRRIVGVIVETMDTTSVKSRREFQEEIETKILSSSKTFGSAL